MKRALSIVIGLALAGCATADASSTGSITLDEFSIVASAPVWRAGPLDFTVANRGERTHTIIVTSATGDVLAATGMVEPGETADFDLTLDPGTYELTCRIVVEGGDGQLFDHYEQGMHTTIEVIAPAG